MLDTITVDTVLLHRFAVAVGLLGQEGLNILSQVSGVDVGILAFVTGVLFLDELLVHLQGLNQFLVGNVVQEGAFAEFALRDDESLLAVSSLLDGLGSDDNEFIVEAFVVDGETDGGDEVEVLVSLSIAEQASLVTQGDGVGHVDVDGVTVTKRDLGGQLESWRPRVTEGDDSVETQLVQVRGFELEHDIDTLLLDLLGGAQEVLGSLLVAVCVLDEVLAVLDEQVPNPLVGASRDLDQLGGTVSDLSNWEGFQEREVEVGVLGLWRKEASETVFSLSIADRNLQHGKHPVGS